MIQNTDHFGSVGKTRALVLELVEQVGENVLISHSEAAIPLFSAVAFDTKDGVIGYWKLQKDDGKIVNPILH